MGGDRLLAINIEWVPRITWMGFVSYKSPWIHFKRNIDEYVLYLIKSGELHIQEDSTRYVLKRGHVLLLEPNRDHAGLEKHTCDYYYIHFKHPDIAALFIDNMESFAKGVLLEDQEREYSSRCYFPKHFLIEDKMSLSQILNSLNELLQLYRRKHYNRSLTALRLSELFIRLSRENLLAELQKNKKRNTKGIVRAHALLDYIHHHYQSRITGKDIETIFECNLDYMNRTFSKLTGYSITHYVNKVRINHARELLEATHLSISEIAFLVGFQEIYYFSKVFKKYVGLSPVAYYKSVREKVGKDGSCIRTMRSLTE
jgi:AraC-like DNA-binding protein